MLRAHDLKRKIKILTTNLCYYCDKERVSFWFCPEHLEKTRQKAIRRFNKRKQSGRCTNCGVDLDIDADQDHKTCIICREGINILTNTQRRKHAVISDRCP